MEARASESIGDVPALDPGYLRLGHWDLDRDFHSLEEIGKGKDTVIYSARCPRLGEASVALKVYDRTRISESKARAIKREVAVMGWVTRWRVPSTCAFHAAFEDPARYVIVMQNCGKGDLLEDLLRCRPGSWGSETRLAREVALPMLETLATMHASRVVHRDVKLENIFLDDAGRVVLGDFGLALCTATESPISPVGTVEYMAPEVVALPPADRVARGEVKVEELVPTGPGVDVWALGVTLFELATGRLPFEGRDRAEIRRRIAAHKLAPFGPKVSDGCASFVRAMLTYDADQRPTALDLLRHPFLEEHLAAGEGTAAAARALRRAAEVRGSRYGTGAPAAPHSKGAPHPPASRVVRVDARSGVSSDAAFRAAARAPRDLGSDATSAPAPPPAAEEIVPAKVQSKVTSVKAGGFVGDGGATGAPAATPTTLSEFVLPSYDTDRSGAACAAPPRGPEASAAGDDASAPGSLGNHAVPAWSPSLSASSVATVTSSVGSLGPPHGPPLEACPAEALLAARVPSMARPAAYLAAPADACRAAPLQQTPPRHRGVIHDPYSMRPSTALAGLDLPAGLHRAPPSGAAVPKTGVVSEVRRAVKRMFSRKHGPESQERPQTAPPSAA